MDLKTLIMLLGLADTATEADVKAAIEKLQKDGKTSATEVATLTAALNDSQTAAVDPAKYVPIEAAAEMQTQIATLTAQLQTGGLDAVIEEAKKDGRLLPAMESWARDLGKKDLAALTAYLDNAAPIAALTTQQAGQETPPRETDAHGLTEEELEAAALTGKSPEEYAALKAT